MEQPQPKSIGKYEILSVIGRGGMGIVYRAQDPLMGRQVAIKTVTEGLNKDPGMLQRFYGEAEKMGMLRHPNIITVYDLGEHDGFPFIVMEFVEGDPLDRLIQSEQQMSLYSKLRIIEQVCGALAYAHQNKVIHRDVKPANVIIRPDGVAKLLDFGIAREEQLPVDRGLTDVGGVIGTVAYMAPERLRRAPFDGRSDIFAVGVLLFQFLTGKLPFTGTEYVLVNQLLNDKHPPLGDQINDYPAALDAILDRALAKDPGDRYQTADEMAADLYYIIEELKREYSAGLMERVERLSSCGDFVGAQDALIQLLKLDNKNTQARALSKEIGLRITLRVRATQAQQKQIEAQEALRNKKFDDAIRLLEEASNLMPDDSAIASELEAVRVKKQINDQIYGYLQQAELARNRGDYTGAREIVEKAIQLDTTNSRLRAAYQSLVQQAEGAARQARLRELLNSANDALQRKSYDTVNALIQEAQTIDPEHFELKEILRATKEGISQEQRMLLLEELEDQISTVINLENAERVALVIQEALEKTPTDAILLRYQAQIGRTVLEYKTRALVEQTVRECSIAIDSAPMEALQRVQDVLINVPGDATLLSLEARIQQQIERMTAQEARSAIMLQAREALSQRKFEKAVEILERCKPPILNAEISELLDYARQESQYDKQRQLVGRSYAEAQTLLHQQKYEDLVRLVAPVALSSKDPGLQSLVDRAQRAIEERRCEQSAALSRVKAFADAQCHEQVVALIQSLPGTVADSSEIRALAQISESAWTQEWGELGSLGRAYAAIESGDWDATQPESGNLDGSALLHEMRDALWSRRRRVVDQVLKSHIEQLRQTKEAAVHLNLLRQPLNEETLLFFASDSVKAEWNSLTARHKGEKKVVGFLTRLRRR